MGNKTFRDLKESIQFKDASVYIDGRKILSKINYKFEKNKINAGQVWVRNNMVDIITGLSELDEGVLEIDGMNY